MASRPHNSLPLLLMVSACLAAGLSFAQEETVLHPKAPRSAPPPVLSLSLDEIAPFVTVPQPAPAVIDVPRDVTLVLRAVTDRPASFTWSGAVSVGGKQSTAHRNFATPGEYVVTVNLGHRFMTFAPEADSSP